MNKYTGWASGKYYIKYKNHEVIILDLSKKEVENLASMQRKGLEVESIELVVG